MLMEETEYGSILAESRLMTGLTDVFHEYMKNPHAHMSTFAVLVKESIEAVMPWKKFLRYK